MREPAAANDGPQQVPVSHTLADQALSSAIAGIVTRICTHPLDTIKARLQTASPESRHNNTIQEIWRHSTWRSLYRGLSVALVGGTPGTVLYLTAYEQLKGQQPQDHDSSTTSSSSFVTHFLAGLTAEALACSIYVPVDVLKERLQVGMYPTLAVALTTIFSNAHDNNNNGAAATTTTPWRTLYRGYWATLASFGPYSAFYFLFYEESKRLVRETNLQNSNHHHSHQPQLSFWWILACSAGSGAAASFITSPLDLVKLRLQLKNSQDNIPRLPLPQQSPPPPPGGGGVLHELSLIYRSTGFRGLFRGAGARVLHFVPATTIAMTTYETCRGSFFVV
jgi:Mitochondrial carrier protein